jgi:hypothetical protein
MWGLQAHCHKGRRARKAYYSGSCDLCGLPAAEWCYEDRRLPIMKDWWYPGYACHSPVGLGLWTWVANGKMMRTKAKWRWQYSLQDGCCSSSQLSPFGLCHAPATFKCLMKFILWGLTHKACLLYLDRLLLAGCSRVSPISDEIFQRCCCCDGWLGPCHSEKEVAGWWQHVATCTGSGGWTAS